MVSVNPVTAQLAEYPMEKLNIVKRRLLQQGRQIFDFGTGDPTIPVAAFIKKALVDQVPDVSSYPSVYGTPALIAAQKGYLQRRFGVDGDALLLLPSTGSKEAIFHIHLSIIGRAGGRRTVAYPDPGYPVYRSGCLFAGGQPYPVRLAEENAYEVRPWEFPGEVIADLAAVWINYPHNPTAAIADPLYLQKIIAWCQEHNVLLLSDECYVDIYDPAFDASLGSGKDQRPNSVLQYAKNGVIAFFSLSKRSGLTGYRSGFMAGDAEFLQAHAKARSNMGVATSVIIQHAATVAWADDAHVEARRGIFVERMQVAGRALLDLGLLSRVPKETFYLWAKVPLKFKGDDEAYCLALAEEGVIASPSSWLSEGVKGFFRLAMVPDLPSIRTAMERIELVSH